MLASISALGNRNAHHVVVVYSLAAGLLIARVVHAVSQRRRQYVQALPSPSPSPRSLAELVDSVVPSVFNSSTNLYSYYRSEIVKWHYYSSFFVEKHGERNNGIRDACNLAFQLMGVLIVNLVLSNFVRETCLRPLWDQVGTAGEAILTACLVNALASPFSAAGGFLAYILEDYVVAVHLTAVRPLLKYGKTEERKEEGLEYFGRETLVVQNRRGTILRAARVAFFRKTFDFISVSAEAQLVLQARKSSVFPWANVPQAFESKSSHWRNYLCFQFKTLEHSIYRPGDPSACMIFLLHCWLFRPLMIVQRLRWARMRAHDMRNAIAAFGQSKEEENAAEQLLLRWFLVHWFGGCTSRILRIVLVDEAESALVQRLRLPRRMRMHLARVLAFLLFALCASVVAAFLVLVYCLPSGGDGTFYLVTCALAHFLHAGVLLPLRVLLSQLWIPSLAREDFLVLHKTCRARFKYVLKRDQEIFVPKESCLLQHFHPACHLARAVPWLSMARILCTLRDGDLLFACRPPPSPPSLQLVVPWESGSPLIGDCMELFLRDVYQLARRIGFRCKKLFSRSVRVALHLLLLLPLPLREAYWDGLLALTLGAGIWGLALPWLRWLVVIITLLLSWALLGSCFLFRGPVALVSDNVHELYRTVNSYFVREKKTTNRRASREDAKVRRKISMSV